MNVEYYLSEIADSNGDGKSSGETMTQLLTNGLKYYGYYPSIYWWNGTAWVQFPAQFGVGQEQMDLPKTYDPEFKNPYCSDGFGQSASEYNAGDYADKPFHPIRNDLRPRGSRLGPALSTLRY